MNPYRSAALLLVTVLLGAASASAQESGAVILPGAYASRQYVSSRAQTRPSNRYIRVRTTSVLLHRVRESDAGTVVESRYCAVEQEPLGRVRTVLGPAFVAAMPIWESKATRDPDGDGPGAIHIAEHTFILGADLSDPAWEDLPDDSNDARVTDPDGDGHPGVTVEVDGFVSGQVYLVQWLTRGLRGSVDPDGRMTGTVIGAGDQTVIGASNAILRTFTPRFEHNPDPKRNTFVWVRVPPESTCETILVARDRLFGED
jgi:hypothetical protein